MVRSAATPRVSNHEALTASIGGGQSRACSQQPLLFRPELSDFGVTRKVVRAFAIDRIHHDAFAVLQRGLADEGTQGRLMVDLAESNLAERRRHRQSFRRSNQLLRIG